jgi:hypothetical protein
MPRKSASGIRTSVGEAAGLGEGEAIEAGVPAASVAAASCGGSVATAASGSAEPPRVPQYAVTPAASTHTPSIAELFTALPLTGIGTNPYG